MKELPDSASKLLFINRLLLSQSVLKNQKIIHIQPYLRGGGGGTAFFDMCIIL